MPSFSGALIVTEAGGSVLSVDGSEFDMMNRGIVAAATLGGRAGGCSGGLCAGLFKFDFTCCI